MKKIFCLFLVISIFLVLCSCGQDESPETSTVPVSKFPTESLPPATQPTDPQPDQSESVTVEENLMTVEISIPFAFLGITSEDQFDVDSYKAQNPDIISVVVNDDSISIFMTQVAHKAKLESLRSEIAEMTNRFVGGEGTEYIKDIKYSDDYTKFEIMVTKDGFSPELDAAEISIVFSVGIYNMYAGVDSEFEIIFIDAENGEILKSAKY